MKKNYNEIDYQIDYDIFTVDEIVKIINFFKMINYPLTMFSNLFYFHK